MPSAEDENLRLEMEIHRLSWQIARERAEELVRDRGWTEKDEDFLLQVEEESRKQWEVDMDRETEKQQSWGL